MNTMRAIPALYSQLPEPVQAAIDSHSVVLVASPVTDLGLVTRWLSQREMDFCKVELSMGSPASRAHFDRLRQVTGWRSLPQIFVNGRFIGGMEQLSALLRQDDRQVSAPAELYAYARWLGYAGLIPFVALTLVSLFAPGAVAEWSTRALLGYGAVILSFVGALHWTRGLDARDAATAAREFVVSVLPALAGWVSLLLPEPSGLASLAVGFGLLYVYDRHAWRLHPGFLALRSQLTAGAMASLVLVWLGAVV